MHRAAWDHPCLKTRAEGGHGVVLPCGFSRPQGSCCEKSSWGARIWEAHFVFLSGKTTLRGLFWGLCELFRASGKVFLKMLVPSQGSALLFNKPSGGQPSSGTGHSEQGGSPLFLGHSGFEEQKMLYRNEKGDAKRKKPGTFPALVSTNCRCLAESMQIKTGCPSPSGSQHCGSDHVPPPCCFTTVHFSFYQHCSFHIVKNECSSRSFPDQLKTRCLPFKFQSTAWSKVNVGVGHCWSWRGG